MHSRLAVTAATLAVFAALNAPALAQNTLLPSRAFTAPGADTGYVFIKRDSSGAGCDSTIYIDGKAITRLAPSQAITRFVPEGHHNVRAVSCGSDRAKIGVDVRRNRLRHFRLHGGSDYAIERADS